MEQQKKCPLNITVSVPFDLWRVLRSIAQAENTTVEAIAQELLMDGIETTGRKMAQIYSQKVRKENILLKDGE